MNAQRSGPKAFLASMIGEDRYQVLARRFGPPLGRLYSLAVVPVRSVATPWGRHSMKRLRGWKDRYRGRRCVIMGNGPSLRYTDWSLLEDEFTFGLNRVYLGFEDMGFSTDVLVSVNRLVIEQCRDELLSLSIPKFFSWKVKESIPHREDVTLLQSVPGPKFSTNPIWGGVWEGATVTYVAMQLAYWMGFHKVVLIGVDHSFQTEGTPHTMVTSTGPDPDHFDPRYFSDGFRWQLPDLETSEAAYRLARRAFEADGRTIVDATEGGELRVFPKTDLDAALADG